jgi:hypothetical protein
MQQGQLNILLAITLCVFFRSFCFSTSYVTNLTSRDRITANAIPHDVT